MKNEPAFPTSIPVVPDNAPYKVIGVEYVKGLSKRELFAAMAMQGLCANPLTDMEKTSDGRLAYRAIEFADALIAELEKSNDQP